MNPFVGVIQKVEQVKSLSRKCQYEYIVTVLLDTKKVKEFKYRSTYDTSDFFQMNCWYEIDAEDEDEQRDDTIFFYRENTRRLPDPVQFGINSNFGHAANPDGDEEPEGPIRKHTISTTITLTNEEVDEAAAKNKTKPETKFSGVRTKKIKHSQGGYDYDIIINGKVSRENIEKILKEYFHNRSDQPRPSHATSTTTTTASTSSPQYTIIHQSAEIITINVPDDFNPEHFNADIERTVDSKQPKKYRIPIQNASTEYIAAIMKEPRDSMGVNGANLSTTSGRTLYRSLEYHIQLFSHNLVKYINHYNRYFQKYILGVTGDQAKRSAPACVPVNTLTSILEYEYIARITNPESSQILNDENLSELCVKITSLDNIDASIRNKIDELLELLDKEGETIE